jgi:hypothetical protein
MIRIEKSRIERRFKVGLENARRTVAHLLSSRGRHRQPDPSIRQPATAISILFSFIP